MKLADGLRLMLNIVWLFVALPPKEAKNFATLKETVISEMLCSARTAPASCVVASFSCPRFCTPC